MKFINKTLLPVAVAVLLATASCSSNKSNLTYFIDRDQIEQSFATGDYNPVIQPDDELFISVTSDVPEASAQYNLPLMNPALMGSFKNNTQAYTQTYMVDSKGDIIFPVYGKLHVEGMTVEQLTEKILSIVSKDVDNPIIKVELMNFKVNVLGEVAQPGVINVNSRRFSVLDALAQAGDMTEFGERDKVILIREEKGKRTIHRLDLNKVETLNSPYFYLQQNDVIYVEPNKIRQDNSKYNQNNAYKLSVISTIVSAASVIASLVIALSVK